MLASCARRSGSRLAAALLARGEGAAAQLLLGDVLGSPCGPLSGAIGAAGASGWGLGLPPTVAACSAAAAWPQSVRPFTSSAASPLHGSQACCSGSRDEQQDAAPATAAASPGTTQPSSLPGAEAGGAAGGAAAAGPGPTGTWLDRLPPGWVPYAQLMRLDKPIGTWLLAWPCFWSITLAAPPGSLPDLRLLALFGAGAVLLRGAGCTVNDLWDRELDRKVERTRSRPLAAGTVTPAQAIAFLGAQLSLGLGILQQLNPFSQVVGAASLALVATYPLMKRVTGWPQAFLGLTFNWGVPFGWAAAHGSIDWAVVLPLYASGVCWTLVYDTIYAHQDKSDDVKAGIRSTALTFGPRTKPICSAFAAAQLALLATAGAAAGCGPAYFAGVAAAGAHLAWQLASVDLDDGPDCAAKFVSNTWVGGLLFGGILADRLAPLLG